MWHFPILEFCGLFQHRDPLIQSDYGRIIVFNLIWWIWNYALISWNVAWQLHNCASAAFMAFDGPPRVVWCTCARSMRRTRYLSMQFCRQRIADGPNPFNVANYNICLVEFTRYFSNLHFKRNRHKFYEQNWWLQSQKPYQYVYFPNLKIYYLIKYFQLPLPPLESVYTLCASEC